MELLLFSFLPKAALVFSLLLSLVVVFEMKILNNHAKLPAFNRQAAGAGLIVAVMALFFIAVMVMGRANDEKKLSPAADITSSVDTAGAVLAEGATPTDTPAILPDTDGQTYPGIDNSAVTVTPAPSVSPVSPTAIPVPEIPRSGSFLPVLAVVIAGIFFSAAAFIL